MDHDEMIAVLAAHRDGKEIQQQGPGSDHWAPLDGEFMFSPNDETGFKYRIKPVPREWKDVIEIALRDRFAGQTMLALRSGPEWQLLEMKTIAAENGLDLENVISHFAYKQADAMLKAREENE